MCYPPTLRANFDQLSPAVVHYTVAVLHRQLFPALPMDPRRFFQKVLAPDSSPRASPGSCHRDHGMKGTDSKRYIRAWSRWKHCSPGHQGLRMGRRAFLAIHIRDWGVNAIANAIPSALVSRTVLGRSEISDVIPPYLALVRN